MSEEQGLTPYETREILFYKTESGEVRVEILLFQENLWLTQAKMAELFDVQKAAISKHLKNIFESGELNEDSVVSKMETTAADGKRYQTNYYNLDAIIAVGYRVNSKKATMFRIWVNRVLKEFIIKGYVTHGCGSQRTFSARIISRNNWSVSETSGRAREGSTRKSRTSIPSAAPTTMWKAPSQRNFSPRCTTSSTMRSPIIPPPRSYMAVPTVPSPTWGLPHGKTPPKAVSANRMSPSPKTISTKLKCET